jgi:hypothetical protein
MKPMVSAKGTQLMYVEMEQLDNFFDRMNVDDILEKLGCDDSSKDNST